VQARQLLAREIGSARGLEEVEADAWIEEQVTPALPARKLQTARRSSLPRSQPVKTSGSAARGPHRGR